MTPALFVECGFKALRHPRIVVARVATWAGSAGGSAGAGVLALPWSIRVAFAHPAAVLANLSISWLAELIPIEVRPYVRTFGAAGLAGEQRLQIGQPDIIGPSVSANCRQVAALVDS